MIELPFVFLAGLLGSAHCVGMCGGFVLMIGAATSASAVDLPAGYMTEKESSAILAKTLHVHLDPDISGLSEAETEVVRKLVAVGRTLSEAVEETGMACEGVETTRSALSIALGPGVELPITEKVAAVLFEGQGAKEALVELMSRDAKAEVG